MADYDLSEFDEQRRQILVTALTAGAFSLASPMIHAAWWGLTPRKLAKQESIFSLEGDVTINGVKATNDTRIDADAYIQTGDNSNIIFVVGTDAFIVRSNSSMQLAGSHFFLDALRLISGKVLTVFGKRSQQKPLNLITPVATIGVRGTGVYMESEPDETYLCTCYGTTQISSNEDPNDAVELTTVHHDAPKFITKNPVKGSRISKAPFRNHTDLELKMLETLVGREVPFGLQSDLYGGARRDY